MLPNFGDEKGVADALSSPALDVPVLVQAYPDDLDQLHVDAAARRVLRQDLGLQQPAPVRHPLHRSPSGTPSIRSPTAFRADLERFLRRLPGRARPATARHGRHRRAARTRSTPMRYSEKLLRGGRHQRQHARSLGGARQAAQPPRRPRAGSSEAATRSAATRAAAACRQPSLVLMAKLGVVVGDWMARARPRRHRHPVLELAAAELRRQLLHHHEHDEREADAERLRGRTSPATVAMYALQLASGTPSALVDWNNNYGDDPDKCVFFHCGNWAKNFLPDSRDRHRRRSWARRSARRTPTARSTGRTPGRRR